MEIAGTLPAADPSSASQRHDAVNALTGLHGRALLNNSTCLSADDLQRSVILIDLDQFEAVNDTYGHSNGDRVLREVGVRLREAAAPHLPLRLSSDEFAVVVSSAERAVCEELAAAIHESIREPIEIDGSALFLDAGIGIGLAHGELTLWELVSRAGASIRPLKRRGRLPRIVVYDDAAHGEILDTLALSLDLRAALTRDQLVLHYQPLVDMTTRRALGFEALVRWVHPIRGVIPPQRFVPLAEEAGLMSELGEWVLTQACTDARSWESRPGEPLYVSVNISIRQLEDPDFTHRFKRAIGRSGLAPSRLKVEITESVLANGVALVLPQLEAIREMGVGVLLDDFGTGYSSLGYIRELPLDGVKLDRIFTRDLTVSAGAWALARSVVTMIGQLELEMIAEGLETAAHLAQLRSLGCHVGQGYYFARPTPRESLQFDGLGRTPEVTSAPVAPILLLEDERATAALIAQLLAAERITNPIAVVGTGAEAVAYLNRVVGGASAMPVLCVLDLSLPDMSGLEVLRHIRTTPGISRLTVIMLTGSGNDSDIDGAYDLGIDAYLIKPAGVHGLPDVVRELHLPYELILESASLGADGHGRG